jgi:hypothetical protein
MAENRPSLSAEQFEHWRSTEFKNHMDQDDQQVLRVQAIESAMASFHNWMKGAIAIGSISAGLFFWILLDKNTTLEQQQLTLQKFAEQQSVIVATLANFTEEMKYLRADNKQQDDRILQILQELSMPVSKPQPLTGRRFDK